MIKLAQALAVLTTVLWSGSYLLNKLAFNEGIGPLTLSGLRYLLAALLLMGITRVRKAKPKGDKLPFAMLLLLGLTGYAIAQGLQYMGQAHLTPTQSSLCLSVGNTTMVVLLDRLWLRENQTRWDHLKLLLLVGGITLYYSPFDSARFPWAGVLLMALSSIGYAAQMTLNRRLLLSRQGAPMTLVAGPMLAGALALLAIGLMVEGIPRLSLRIVLMLGYLSGVSGALGFFLWTKSQQALTAFESSGINNLMLIEIALMDFLFFGRAFSALQLGAIAIVFGAIIWIQAGRSAGKKA